jgi:hypothetical protein
MRHYREAMQCVAGLRALLQRRPVTAQTAPQWFEAAHEILEIAGQIRREAWKEMSDEDRSKLLEDDPKLRALEPHLPG